MQLSNLLCLIASAGSAAAAPASSPYLQNRAMDSTDTARGYNSTVNSLIDGIVDNINVPDGLPGLPIASPSRTFPNYYYHWTRDGALTISAILTHFELTGDKKYSTIIEEYFNSSAILQTVPNLSGGIGEPKYYINGTAFNESWGRPQNDGPALRALVSMKTARDWSKDEQMKLWNKLIKTDVEFVVKKWNEKGYDLWEELLGYHFFTSLMQYGSLHAAAAFSQRAGMSSNYTQTYLNTATKIEKMINEKFLNSTEHIIEHNPADLGKRAGLDAASIIAILELHDLAGWTEGESNIPDLMITLNEPLVKKTLTALATTFGTLYPINAGKPGGIGRYYEDIYDGISTSQGNPWFICTASVAEAYLRLNDTESAAPHIDFVDKYRGDTISEEVNRYTGVQQGAEKLTWSLSSVIRMTAVLQKMMKN